MTTPVLRISHLTNSFGDRTVVNDLTLDVKRGEVFGFLGPNGAGKSTTIRMILSLVKPESGDVELFGNSISSQKSRALHRVGALIEDADFYENLTAKTNLSMLARMQNISDKRIDEVLKIVHLYDRRNDRVKAYSHGMKQRLGIAQALLSEPELLILDEPTAGLDPRGMKDVRQLVRELSEQGMTIFLSSHLLHEVEMVCSSLAIINHGKLVVTGSVRELMETTDLFTTEIHAKPLEKAATVLRSLDSLRDVTIDDAMIKVSATSVQVPEITRALVNAEIDVSAIVPRSSLEDYFLSLTGGEAVHDG